MPLRVKVVDRVGKKDKNATRRVEDENFESERKSLISKQIMQLRKLSKEEQAQVWDRLAKENERRGVSGRRDRREAKILRAKP